LGFFWVCSGDTNRHSPVATMNYIKAVQTWGVKETFKKFFTLKQIKFGTLVGVDENGNKYFENLNEPYGKLPIFGNPG